MTTKPRAPAGLGVAGLALWSTLHTVFRFGVQETPVVLAACASADVIAKLERIVAVEGVTTVGSQGQVRVHPALAEARQQRLAQQRLLAALAVPVEDAVRPMTIPQERARRAALVRWDRPGARTRSG